MIPFRVNLKINAKDALDRLSKHGAKLSDLTPFWQNTAVPVTKRLFASIFQGEGQTPLTSRWAPLSPQYKAWKERNYPGKTILRRTDRLFHSVVNNPNLNITPERLTFGTNVPYASFHETGTSKMPARPLFGYVETNAPMALEPLLLEWLEME